MARTHTLIFIFLTALYILTPDTSQAQAKSYELIPAPDLWYNDVDGIRVGVRLLGQVPGTFEDGPHRLDAGFWLGTWFPDLPVSYYLSFTEPVSAWSEYGSEANIQLISSVRTGYHLHGLVLNKRWQEGFDERRYREFRWMNTLEKRFDEEYTAFPQLWSDETRLLSGIALELQDDNTLGWYNISGTGTLQLLDEVYALASLTAIQRIPFNENWGLRLRGFVGASGSSSVSEYRYSRSSSPAVETIQSGITRAKGTIPQPWMESGYFQVSGGANLRGYTKQDIDSFTDSSTPVLYNSITAFNTELDYPNPIRHLFNRIPYLSEFMEFRSYLFFDAGIPLDEDQSTLFADAGAGFSLSLNIPDYLGKPRGFVLRYELPLWLSEPGAEDSLKLRHLIGFGAVISF